MYNLHLLIIQREYLRSDFKQYDTQGNNHQLRILRTAQKLHK